MALLSTTEPIIQPCDTGQWIPFFESCQLTITWHGCQYIVASGLQASMGDISNPLT